MPSGGTGFVETATGVEDFLLGVLRRTGVSGYEGDVAEYVREAFSGLVDESRRDKLGNLILHKRGEGEEPRVKVMLCAHMDEIGLIVTKIEDGGFLRFTSVGGIDQRVLLSAEVVVHGRRDLPGFIGAKPPHIQEHGERRKSVKMNDMFIDVGLSKEELVDLVRVGDIVSIRRDPCKLKERLVAGRSIDDRGGVACMFACAKELAGLRHAADVYFVASVQEEVGLRGAMTSTYGIVPDVGIAIDVGHGDMPGVSEADTIPLDKGPAIALGPQTHPRIFERLTRVASDRGIAYQVEPSPSPGGTDAWAIQITRAGIPSALVSLPLRYMHTSVETVSVGDIEKTGRLLAYFIAGLDKAFVEGLRCF